MKVNSRLRTVCSTTADFITRQLHDCTGKRMEWKCQSTTMNLNRFLSRAGCAGRRSSSKIEIPYTDSSIVSY
eukprot:745909-Hanusia_phi.AAC.2